MRELLEYVNIGLARVLFHLHKKKGTKHVLLGSTSTLSLFYFNLKIALLGVSGSRFMFGVVQSYPWIEFYFPLLLNMVIYDNEFKTKENKV